MSDNDVFGLACQTCGHIFPTDITVGVAAAHFETEHGTDAVKFDLVVLCNRCHKAMTLDHEIGNQMYYACLGCKRSRAITRNTP